MRHWLGRLTGFISASALVVAALAAFAPNAAADTQIKSPVDMTGSATLNICSFPISLTAHVTGFRIRFFDNNGVKYKAIWEVSEQDVLSANGKIVTGPPYHYSEEFDFANGVLVGATATGVMEKLVLPDGTLFLSAGWLDALAAFEGGPEPSGPNFGVTGDIGALCAALAP